MESEDNSVFERHLAVRGGPPRIGLRVIPCSVPPGWYLYFGGATKLLQRRGGEGGGALLPFEASLWRGP
jgi:hypothetical protein